MVCTDCGAKSITDVVYRSQNYLCPRCTIWRSELEDAGFDPDMRLVDLTPSEAVRFAQFLQVAD